MKQNTGNFTVGEDLFNSTMEFGNLSDVILKAVFPLAQETSLERSYFNELQKNMFAVLNQIWAYFTFDESYFGWTYS